MSKTSLTQLQDNIEAVTRMLGVEGFNGRTYVHKKSGGYYIARGAGYNESDMAIMVEYSPLSHPRVKFYRPWVEFQKKFSKVVQPTFNKAGDENERH